MIGVGVLPVLVALTWLFGARWRLPDERALAATLVGAIVAFGLYTAVKASYLSTNFAIRVEERNLIYIAPVVFAVTARWVIAGRARPIPVLLSAAAVWYLIDTTPYHNTEHFYSDAPGLSILQWLNRKPFYFTTTDAHRLLLGILFGSVALMVLREVARAPRLPAPPRPAGRSAGGGRDHRLEPDRRDRRRERLQFVLGLDARRPADAPRLDRPGDRAGANDVHRPVARRLERVLVGRVLEPVDLRRVVGRCLGARPRADHNARTIAT